MCEKDKRTPKTQTQYYLKHEVLEFKKRQKVIGNELKYLNALIM